METAVILETVVPKKVIGKPQEDPYTITADFFFDKKEIITIRTAAFTEENKKEPWYKLVKNYMIETNSKPYAITFSNGAVISNVFLTDSKLSDLIHNQYGQENNK